MNELYERITALCKEQGITGSRMLKDLGISASLLSDMKNGRRESPRPDKLKLIADYLGVSVDQLISGEDSDKETALRAAFFGGYEGLSEKDIDELWTDVRNFTDFIVDKKKQEQQEN